MNSFKVTRKEVREMARDRRVRVAFLMPIFIVFMMIQLFGFIESAATSAQNQTIYYVKTNNSLLAGMKSKNARLIEVPSVAAGEAMILSGKAAIVLDFGPLPSGPRQQETITAYFDPQKDTSQITLAALGQLVQNQSKSILIQTLKAHDIPAEAADPIKLQKHEVKVGTQGAGQMIVSLLPYLIVLFAFTGGASLASDLVAGEKEKNTLETLLITPVSRTQIVIGKFLALCTVCFGGCVTALVGLALAGANQAGAKSEMFKGGLGITPVSALTILILMIPMVAFFASILIAISSYARNSREAQTYLALVNVVVILPAVFSQVIGFTDLGTKLWINFVPILNTANNIRNALLGRTDPLAVLITVCVSLLIAGIAIWIAIWLFNREEVLTRV
jgi:sodium transport system permease protein